MVVLITGISSGFGLETARLLSQEGHTVYGTVRRAVEPLPKVHYLQVDVRDKQAVADVVRQVVEKEGRIDVLVNNAGMGIGGPLEFATEEEIRLQMDTNFMGLVHCVDAVLPYMRQQKSGKIFAMSSIGGLMGLPFQGFYSASKFAIEGYCEALRLETKSFGIQVVVLRPGDFATGFTGSRKKVADEAALEAYPIYKTAIAKVEHDENGGLKPEVLAKKNQQGHPEKTPAQWLCRGFTGAKTLRAVEADFAGEVVCEDFGIVLSGVKERKFCPKNGLTL